jgi:hypothetical protein
MSRLSHPPPSPLEKKGFYQINSDDLCVNYDPIGLYTTIRYLSNNDHTSYKRYQTYLRKVQYNIKSQEYFRTQDQIHWEIDANLISQPTTDYLQKVHNILSESLQPIIPDLIAVIDSYLTANYIDIYVGKLLQRLMDGSVLIIMHIIPDGFVAHRIDESPTTSFEVYHHNIPPNPPIGIFDLKLYYGITEGQYKWFYNHLKFPGKNKDIVYNYKKMQIKVVLLDFLRQIVYFTTTADQGVVTLSFKQIIDCKFFIRCYEI